MFVMKMEMALFGSGEKDIRIRHMRWSSSKQQPLSPTIWDACEDGHCWILLKQWSGHIGVLCGIQLKNHIVRNNSRGMCL
ncbi:hypothetical protein D5086_002031 [Populus alba]|uniref:Uncharacterized protein n=1 Tax=Populus alba TaxID=43335 RepID=A0ACC4D0D8_POPAL